MILFSDALARVGAENFFDGDAGMLWPEGDAWNVLYARCESPIERRMCLEISGRLGYVACADRFDDCPSLRELLAEYGAIVFGQQPVGNFRADFLIAMFMPGWRRLSVAAIECDGHEFHSAPEAVAYDAMRDRAFSARGLKVIRFAGHEIMRRASTVMGRIPQQMGAGPADFDLWGATQAESEEMSEPGDGGTTIE